MRAMEDLCVFKSMLKTYLFNIELCQILIYCLLVKLILKCLFLYYKLYFIFNMCQRQFYLVYELYFTFNMCQIQFYLVYELYFTFDMCQIQSYLVYELYITFNM